MEANLSTLEETCRRLTSCARMGQRIHQHFLSPDIGGDKHRRPGIGELHRSLYGSPPASYIDRKYAARERGEKSAREQILEDLTVLDDDDEILCRIFDQFEILEGIAIH